MNGYTNILYISGAGRSGSTLLGKLLGQMEGVAFCGELRTIWQGLVQNELCSCGSPLRNCPFWKSVLHDAYGGYSDEIGHHAVALTRRVASDLQIPRLFLKWRSRRFQKDLEDYIDIVSKLYRAIQNVSGCSIIVDSSKKPTYAFALDESPDLAPSVIHLVRDSRAVAYSWRRRKMDPQFDKRDTLFERRSLFHRAIRWNIRNAVVSLLARKFAGRFVLLRYEDFLAKPKESLIKVIQISDHPLKKNEFKFLDDPQYAYKAQHIPRGNPNRFQMGAIEICPDSEWKTRMRKAPRLLVSLITWPLLSKYGYVQRRNI